MKKEQNVQEIEINVEGDIAQNHSLDVNVLFSIIKNFKAILEKVTPIDNKSKRKKSWTPLLRRR